MPQTFALSILSHSGGRSFLLSPAARSRAAGLFVFQASDPVVEQDARTQVELTAQLLNQLTSQRHAIQRSDRSPPLDPLVPLGRLVGRLYPPAIALALGELPPGSPLCIAANDPDLPWELAHDGQDYLALRHVTARQLLIGQSPRRDAARKTGRWTTLLIGNSAGALPHVADEIDVLSRLIQALPGTPPARILMRQRATRSAALHELSSGGYDLVHFSGHIHFDPTKPDASGLLLADGEILTGADIRRSLAGQPVVFLNGCRSARSDDALGRAGLDHLGTPTAGLAAAFVQGGARVVVGSLWPVHDTSSRDFALAFYRLALRGDPVGDALHQARLAAHAAAPWDPLWAAFTLYGDPMLQLVPATRAERRPATVLVVHLRGLTALFAMDRDEDAAAKLAELTASLRTQAVRYGGEISALAHDLLTIVFGLPALHENDTERAARAALDMLANVTLLGHPVPISLGISAGQVFVGPGSSAEPIGRMVMGSPVNQAAHLARQADPGTILVSESVRRLAGTVLELAPVPAISPEDAGGLPIYRLVGLQPGTIALPGVHQPSRFVGRDRELAAFREAWQACRQGRGQLVSLAGEAGIGKSRLLVEFSRVVRETGGRWLSTIAPSAYTPRPYEVIAQLFRAVLDPDSVVEGGDMADRQHAALEQLLAEDARGEAGREGLALLGDLLWTTCPDPRTAGLEPKVRQRQLAFLLGKLLASLANRGPLVIACDDLHAADTASLETLAQLAPGLDRLPVLLVAAYRAEVDWQPPWSRRRNHTSLRLDALDVTASRAFLASLLAVAEPPEDVTRAVLSQAGGNPLFIRELVTELRESGALQEDSGAWCLTSRVDSGSVPDTVQRVILARIDRLPVAARRLLPLAAVVGDEVAPTVLRAALVETEDTTMMEDGLVQLEEREFIFRRWPTDHYGFAHALLRSVAYDALTDEMRQRYHGRIGRALAAAYAGREIEALELLAHHYDRSDERVPAVHYGLWAARRAADAWANASALSWYNRVSARINAFLTQPPTEVEQEAGAAAAQIFKWRVDTLTGRAGVSAATGRSEDALADYRAALDLMTESPGFTTAERADLCRKIAIVHHDQGHFEEAESWLSRGLTLVGGDRVPEAGRLHVWHGMVGFRLGRLSAALDACGRGIATLAQTDNPRDLAQAYNLQGLIQRNLGESRQALAAHELSLALYRQTSDIAGLERAYSNLGCVYQDLSRWTDALRCFEQSVELCERTGEPRRQAAAAINLGEIYRRQGRLDQAIAAYDRARQTGDEFGYPEATGMALMDQGACYLRLEQYLEADACLERSLAIFRELGSDVYLPEILRYRAELRAAMDEADQALTEAQEALAWAERLGRRLEAGQALRAVGLSYRLLGQYLEADAALSRSLAILEAQDSPYEIGLTLLEMARLCIVRADESNGGAADFHESARTYSGRAYVICEHLGARLELAQAEALCKRLGKTSNNTGVR